MTYILGNAPTAQLRLELLDELTTPAFLEAIKRLPSSNMRIVILGCGSAYLEARLGYIFSSSHFIGIDISKTRIAEAKERVKTLPSTNIYEFIEQDITKISPDQLGPCDILISRFVLSHIQNGDGVLKRLSHVVKKGGYICTEEGASTGREYYVNSRQPGYERFVSLVEGVQSSAQKSAFDIGLRLLSNPIGKVIYTHLTQPILATARHKSILRLGAEEAKSTLSQTYNLDELITDLKKFEEDERSFGLYMRYVTMITVKSSEDEGH